MNITFYKNIKFNNCKSNFLISLPNKESLPQYAEFKYFVDTYNDATLIINHGYRSLDQLCLDIINVSQSAQKYFYLAINKFYIYSTKDLPISSGTSYDTLLIQYCRDLIKSDFELINSNCCNNDDGTLGNFVHPITSLVFKRHDKKSN